MFSSNPNYTKLKTHLRLAINRLKLLEKKKTELTQKARKEIAEYIAAGKSERAKIRVEHIIREDYMVEAMEIVEMYCDLILARFGLVTQMKELDEGLAEAISCLLWVAPRMHTDIQELKVISDLLTAKYGKIYAEMCRNESVNTVSEKLRHKMSVQSPPKILVERYLIEIAKNYNVNYTPDENVMREEEARDAMLIDIGGPPAPPGFIGYGPQMPNLPPPNVTPFNYPTSPSGGKAGGFIANPNYGGTPENYGGTPPGNYGGTPPGNYGGGTPQGNYGGGTPQGNYGAPIHPGSYGSQSYGGPSQGGYNLPPGVDSKTLSNSFLQDEMSNLPPAYDSIHHDMPNLPAVPSGPTYESTPQGPNSYGSTSHGPTPQPRSRPAPASHFPELPELPSVPSDLILPSVPNSNTSVVHGNNAGTPGSMSASDEIDFEDLNRRFEELKKKK